MTTVYDVNNTTFTLRGDIYVMWKLENSPTERYFVTAKCQLQDNVATALWIDCDSYELLMSWSWDSPPQPVNVCVDMMSCWCCATGLPLHCHY